MKNTLHQLKHITWLSTKDGIVKTIATLLIIITATILIFGVNIFSSLTLKTIIELIS